MDASLESFCVSQGLGPAEYSGRINPVGLLPVDFVTGNAADYLVLVVKDDKCIT